MYVGKEPAFCDSDCKQTARVLGFKLTQMSNQCLNGQSWPACSARCMSRECKHCAKEMQAFVHLLSITG